MCSFRAEAYGFLTGISLLNSLLVQLPTTTVAHTIHTDSASLLSQLVIATARVPIGFWLKPDSDVVKQIAEEAKKIPTLNRHYVKGHQDSKKKRQDLTQPELYNIDADASATKMRYEMQQPATKVIHFPACSTHIYVHQQHRSSAIDPILHESYTNSDYWAYLESKYQWTEPTRRLIAWEIHHHTLNQQPIKQHQQLIKYIYDWLPTGQVVHRNDHNEDHRCPHCRTVYEKKQHLLRCPHPSRADQRDKFLTIQLHNFYHKSNTAQPLRELISQSLIQWF
jgi:hypothetical protein